MDPYQQPLTPYEQRLRDEVLYLHSLWHRGPHPPPLPSASNFLPHFPSNPRRNLPVFNPPSFKKTNRRNHFHPPPLPDPGPEWPVDPPPSSSPAASGWIPFEPKPPADPPKLSDVDEFKAATLRLQLNVMSLCDDFYAKMADSDGEEDYEFLGEEGAEDSFDVEQSEEFKFFFGLFVENREMRDFYEKNQESGGFWCLVCGKVGKPAGKLFKSVHGLVQHANQILKTKRRRAHRAFGLTICRVLGWDITRLPAVVVTGQPLSQSLANLGETLNCLKKDDGKKVVEDGENKVCGTQDNAAEDNLERCLKEDDCEKVVQNIDNGACVAKERKLINNVENFVAEDDCKKVVEGVDSGTCITGESQVVNNVEGKPKENND